MALTARVRTCGPEWRGEAAELQAWDHDRCKVQCPLPRSYPPIPDQRVREFVVETPEASVITLLRSVESLWRSLACVCHDRSCIRTLTGISSVRGSEQLCAANSLICPPTRDSGLGHHDGIDYRAWWPAVTREPDGAERAGVEG